jgi:RimJ/RimL family protein N-acetyltransferase
MCSFPIRPPKVPPTDGVVRVRLRRDDDLRQIAAAAEDPKADRWLDEAPGSAPPSTPLQILEIWRSGRAAPLIIADAVTDKPAGLINLQFKSDTEATVAYRVFPIWRGRGFAARTLDLAAGWAFGELDLPRLALEIDEDNAASIRVAERCAFARRGLRAQVTRRNSSLSAPASGLGPDPLTGSRVSCPLRSGQSQAGAAPGRSPAPGQSGRPATQRGPGAGGASPRGRSGWPGSRFRRPGSRAAGRRRAMPRCFRGAGNGVLSAAAGEGQVHDGGSHLGADALPVEGPTSRQRPRPRGYASDTAGHCGPARRGPRRSRPRRTAAPRDRNAAGCELGEGQQIALAGPAQF